MTKLKSDRETKLKCHLIALKIHRGVAEVLSLDLFTAYFMIVYNQGESDFA